MVQKLSRSVEAKYGKLKQKNQKSVHWDDRAAIYFCKWFEPVMSNGADVLIDGCKAFTMPISCKAGFNWQIKGSDGMVLCPVRLSWSDKNKVFLLEREDRRCSEEHAMSVTTSDTGVAQYVRVGPPQSASPASGASKKRISRNEGEEHIRQNTAARTRRANKDAMDAEVALEKADLVATRLASVKRRRDRYADPK